MSSRNVLQYVLHVLQFDFWRTIGGQSEDNGSPGTRGKFVTPGVEKPILGLQTGKEVCWPEHFRIWMLSGGFLTSRPQTERTGLLRSLSP